MIGDGWQVWSTYRPSDLLLFSARTYRRLFELYDDDHRVVHMSLAAGVTVLLLVVAAVHWRAPAAGRAGADDDRACAATGRSMWVATLATACLALAWAWIGWAFHLQRYATINWIAPAFAAAFFVQMLLLTESGRGGCGKRRQSLPPVTARLRPDDGSSPTCCWR